MDSPDDAGARLYVAICEAVRGGELTVDEVAARVGCSPREVIAVLLRHDRASRVSIVPGYDPDVGAVLVRLQA